MRGGQAPRTPGWWVRCAYRSRAGSQRRGSDGNPAPRGSVPLSFPCYLVFFHRRFTQKHSLRFTRLDPGFKGLLWCQTGNSVTTYVNSTEGHDLVHDKHLQGTLRTRLAGELPEPVFMPSANPAPSGHNPDAHICDVVSVEMDRLSRLFLSPVLGGGWVCSANRSLSGSCRPGGRSGHVWASTGSHVDSNRLLF